MLGRAAQLEKEHTEEADGENLETEAQHGVREGESVGCTQFRPRKIVQSVGLSRAWERSSCVAGTAESHLRVA